MEEKQRNFGLWSAFKQTLICVYFLSVPFTWSYLTTVSGFLVRLNDVVMLVIISIVFASGKISLSRYQKNYFCVFAAMLCFIGLSGTISNYLPGFITTIKVAYFLTGAACACHLMTRLGEIEPRVFLGVILVFFAYLVLLRPEVFASMIENLSKSGLRPTSFAFLFWNDIFEINLFGPSGVKDIRGVSFRNTAGLGFLTLGMFTFGFVKKSKITIPLTLFFLMLCIATLSRSAGACAVLFIIFFTYRAKLGPEKWLYVVVIVFTILFLATSFVAEILRDRIASRVGRGDLIREGLLLMFEHPFFGAGAEGKLEGYSNIGHRKTVHNVPVALGAQYGILVFFLAVLVLIQNFRLGFSLFVKTFRKTTQSKSMIWCLTGMTCCAALVVSPLVSASADVFYSAPAWAALALAFVCSRQIAEDERDV